MKPLYTAYSKTIDGVSFYFVKTYQSFPEYKNVPPLLENYSMHTNFEQACKIAMIFDKDIQHQLLTELEDTATSKVLSIYPTTATKVYKLKYRQTFSPLLKLIGVR